MKEVIQHRDFRKLFVGNLFSSFGQGMSMIGIPWYLVESTGSADLLGSTMFITAVMLLFIAPYLGTLVDRFSRKMVLQVENIVGFTVLILFAAWGFVGEYQEWMLIAIYFYTITSYQIHYPAQSALVQETFDQKYYQSANSWLEIEGQTAAVLAGALAGIVLSKWGLHIALLLDALTYLFAFIMLSGMNYTFTLGAEAKEASRTSWMDQFHKSWLFVKERRGFLLFGVSVLMPFIAVMASNLLAPVYVSQTLKADVLIFSLSDMTYAIGATSAGFLGIFVARSLGDRNALLVNIALFSISLILLVLIPNGWVFSALYTCVGWANAASRLIRQNIYMGLIPKAFMGRVLSFLNSVGMVMRLILIGGFTLMLDYTGAGLGYLILAGLLLLAGGGIVVSMRMLNLQGGQAEEQVQVEQHSQAQ
ncbi:MFS transporter [Brevibacillus dissolubilis]|uniref:MFS transporter n=1 Tax=Brevibacillus dissolubilis TaxID=1844116 RepID=UPI0011170514|nr:MFS transporter [Brevibacillus dissolubilis]